MNLHYIIKGTEIFDEVDDVLNGVVGLFQRFSQDVLYSSDLLLFLGVFMALEWEEKASVHRLLLQFGEVLARRLIKFKLAYELLGVTC